MTISISADLAVDLKQTRVLIVGAGFAGIGMAIQLRAAGIEDFVILERGTAAGGTWRDNNYPGCACDVPSPLYSFSFEPNPHWSHVYANQAEIQAYLCHCIEKYQLATHFRYGECMVSARYDDACALWRVTTLAGAHYEAKVLITATGGLSSPEIPNLPGRAQFSGTSFHSARWNHACDLHGKRVAVIGTGASAIQFLPQIATQAAHVDLYQRSAAWVLPKRNRAISRVERSFYHRVPRLQQFARMLIYGRLEARALSLVFWPQLLRVAELLAARHLRREIEDPALRAQLTPDYRIGCKRILISDDFYPALARPNVSVVTSGIRELTAAGIVDDDGVERPADVIIYGTGFKVQAPVRSGVLIGRGGLDLSAAWRDGAQAYLGMSITGFPNFFMLTGPNSGIGHSSLLLMIEAQVQYVVSALQTMTRLGLRAAEVRPEVQAQYNETLQRRARGTVWASGCKSWYLDSNGRNTTMWPGFTFVYRYKTRTFKHDDYLTEPA